MNGRQLFWKKSTLINYQFIMEVQWRTPMETQNVHPRLVFSINHVRSAGRNFPELFQWGKQVERVRWNTLMNTSFKEKWHYLFLTILRRCLLQFLGNVYFSPQLRTKSKCELANKKKYYSMILQFNMGGPVPKSYYFSCNKPVPTSDMVAATILSGNKLKLKFEVTSPVILR